MIRKATEKDITAVEMIYNAIHTKEVDIVPTVFNGIPGVNLVLLEKYLGE